MEKALNNTENALNNGYEIKEEKDNSAFEQVEAKITSAKQNRLLYVDVARFLCMFLVVFCHALGRDVKISSLIYTFHLPAFFVLNGITLKFKENESFGDFLVKKIKGYVVPVICLGFIEILLTQLVNQLTNVPVGENFIWNKFADLIGQEREYTIWFVACLFTTDVLFYSICKLVKGNLFGITFFVALTLYLAIFFNKKLPTRSMFWNFDVALFGVLFVYFGYLFAHKKIEKINRFLLKNRLISLLFGLLFLGIGLWLGQINYQKTNLHLEMWARQYKEYYLILPSAVIASMGIILFSRAVENKFFGEVGKTTLIIIAFHQVFTMPIFNNFVAKAWWKLSFTYADNSGMLYLFALASSLFSFITLTPLYYLFKWSPFAFMIGKNVPAFYGVKFNKVMLYIKNFFSKIKLSFNNEKTK